MKGAKILFLAQVTDDFGEKTSILRSLPCCHGNMLLSLKSYLRVKKERDAEGLRTPDWESLPIHYLNGEYK